MASDASPLGGSGANDFPVVVLVGSAGGLQAAVRVLQPLPRDLPAALVLLIHLPPEHVSSLVEVIARSCPLPVLKAEHGLPLLPGHVIVVPPGKHLLITADADVPRTALIESGEYPPSRPSADLLLATLATAVGKRAIAVILSGGGNDGATGATAVHACGGTVLASDATSSDHYSMPLAAIRRDNAVDQVLPLDEIAPAIDQIVAARAG